MRVLLDTTYLLPVIGFSIKGMPSDTPLKLLEKGYEISLSDITFFELAAKGAKYVTEGELPADRVSKGIRALVYDERIHRISAYQTSVLLTSFTLRKVVSDFIDCLILSSAINHCDKLVTEDKLIHELEKRILFKEIIKAKNPEFEIQKISDII